LAEQPAIARRILDGGHDLGNHTENHRDISRMSPAAAFGEINTCAQRIRKLTGSIGTWFRPSQTQHANALIRAQAIRVGYPTCVSYDVDSLDYTDPGSSAVTRATLRQLRPGSIVSLHFGHPDTLAAIGPILDGLRQRRLHAVTMTELMS
jgi:peptidoglycan/xylan/chitin deacetylase (PgdA/CDA1 family)